MSGVNNKLRILIGGQFNKGDFELAVLYLEAGENVGWKVMRKVNKVGKLDIFWQCRSDLVVEDDLGLKAVVCRKVWWKAARKGSWKKAKTTGQPGESNATQNITRQNTLPGHLKHQLISSFVCISEAAT